MGLAPDGGVSVTECVSDAQQSGASPSHMGSESGNEISVVVDRRKFRRVLWTFLAVRLLYRQQMPHAKRPGAAQDRQGVIDKQTPCRVEADIGLQGIPELRVLLGETVIVGADQPLEIRRQFNAFQLQ